MIGVNYTGHVHQGPLDLLYNMGVRAVRYWINGAAVIKARDAYDFSQVEADLRTIRDSGLYVYANWSSVPAFMSEGVPAYLPLGCWVPRKVTDPEPNLDPSQGPGGWRFARPDEKPYCHMPNVPDIDDQQVEAFTYALGSELSDLIDWFGDGNELEIRDFWPPIADPDYKGVGYTRYLNQVHRPSIRGYRRGCTGGAAVIVGPECATAGGLRMLLELEREKDMRLWDVLSGHLYPWDGQFPGDSYERAADFVNVMRQLGEGRPFWDTESDGPNPAYVDRYVELRKRHGDLIRGHFRYAPWRWFEESEEEFNKGHATPNAEYRRMKQILKGETPKRRRAVRT